MNLAAGTLTNSGTILTTGTNAGVLFTGNATIANTGTIIGRPGISLNGASNSIVNGQSGSAQGLISGYFNGVFSGTAVSALLVNYGTIRATSTVAGSGISLNTGTVTNFGTISAGGSGIGVNLSAGGTVIDSGTISGAGGAISFGGTGANLLVLENGYKLIGNVVGSGTARARPTRSKFRAASVR